jgi:hypothetical protein
MPEEDATAAIMQAVGEEVLDRLAQVIEGLQILKREGDERHPAVMGMFQALRVQETLEWHTRQFEALFRLLSGTALWKIWLRATLFTGAAWGLGLAGVHTWDNPALAAKVREMGHLIAAFF